MHQLCLIFFIGIFCGVVAPPPTGEEENSFAALIVKRFDTKNVGFLTDSEFIEISETYETNKGLARAKFGNSPVFPDKSSITTLFKDIVKEMDTESTTGKLTPELLATFLKSDDITEAHKRFAAFIIYLVDDLASDNYWVGYEDRVLTKNKKFSLDNYFGLEYTEEQSALTFERLHKVLLDNQYAGAVLGNNISIPVLVDLMEDHLYLYRVLFPLKSKLQRAEEKAKSQGDNEDDEEASSDDEYY